MTARWVLVNVAIVEVVLGALGGGVGLAVAGLQGALRTALSHDQTSFEIGRVDATSLAGSPFAGRWWVHGGSLVVREDAMATISYRHGFCGPDLAEDCYSDWRGPGGTTSVRYRSFLETGSVPANTRTWTEPEGRLRMDPRCLRLG